VYNQLKEVINEIDFPKANKNKISKRTRFLMDKFRDRTFILKSNGKVYVIKFDDSLDIFDENDLIIEYDYKNKEQIRYLEPKMQHSRKHYGTVGRILEVMSQVKLSKTDRANFERYMLKYA
jgi:hypothetical protein